MTVAQVQQVLSRRSWSVAAERDLLFWWVVKYTDPQEAADVLSALPDDVRARFVRWLDDKRPGTPWIDRLGIFEGPDDIDMRLSALRDAAVADGA